MQPTRRWLTAALLISLIVPCSRGAEPAAVPAERGWTPGVSRVEIGCSDGCMQAAMWYAPADTARKPLLVGLHTWSSTYATAGGDAVFAQWCIARGWAFLHPDFRGPNRTADAMGSPRAVRDVVEAVAWAKQQTAVDEDRVYLIGGSGGGHMSLLMAGRHPELWAGVTAWCGISDIAEWHREHVRNGAADRYAKDIESALGGVPDTPERQQAAWDRSPLSCLAAARNVPLDINHGIHDGRTGSVPFTHSLRAFNAVVAAADERLTEADCDAFYNTQTLPSGWLAAEADASYDRWRPLFRRIAGSTRLTIFEGGHELVPQAALNWLAHQRRGQPAVWQIENVIPLGDPNAGPVSR